MNFYFIVQADSLLYWYSKLTGTKGLAKMGAFFPFIWTTKNVNPLLREYFINHERIHLAQQVEKLLIGQWIITLIETICFYVFHKESLWSSYIYQCGEQEAYDNMYDLNYLTKRKLFADLRYYFFKKKLGWDLISKQRLLKEGYVHLRQIKTMPFQKILLSTQKYNLALTVIRGSLEILNDHKTMFAEGERMNLAPNSNCVVLTGSRGCLYLEGKKI